MKFILIYFLTEKNFIIFFSREEFHIQEIFNKEIYLLPVIIDQDQIFIYNQNYFYENWKKFMI